MTSLDQTSKTACSLVMLFELGSQYCNQNYIFDSDPNSRNACLLGTLFELVPSKCKSNVAFM